jgi:hypothetical protein
MLLAEQLHDASQQAKAANNAFASDNWSIVCYS